MPAQANIKAVVTAEDRATQVLRKFAAEVESAGVRTTRMTQVMHNGFTALGSGIRKLGVDIASHTRGLIVGLADDFVMLGQRALDLAKRLGSIAWGTFKKGVLAVSAAIAGLGAFGIKTAANLEAMQLSLIGLTKSVEVGKKAMAGALAFAQKAPFQLTEVVGTTKSLVAFGIEAQQAVEHLDLLGNLALTTGVPLEDLGFIFGKVSASGRLMTEEINQLTERGVSILPALQKQLGKTAQEVREMASAGEISFEEFRKAIQSIVDPQIMGMLENTLPRQWDRLKGSIRILSFAFVGASVDMENGFTKASDGIAQATVNLTRSVADLLRSDSIKAAASEFGKTMALAIQGISDAINNNKPAIDRFFFGMANFFKEINETVKTEGIKKPFLQLADSVNKAIGKIDFNKLASRAMDGFANAVNNLNYAKYAEIATKSILGIFAAVDYAALTAGVVVILVKAVPGIISGFIQGVIDVATSRPMDMLQFILAIGFIPGKVVAALGTALSRIPLVGPVASWILQTLKSATDFVLSPITALFHKIGSLILGGIKSGGSAAIGRLSELFGSVLAHIQTFFAAAGSWLVGAGRSLISGFANGIRSLFGAGRDAAKAVADNATSFFKNAGHWLVDAGSDLISGFINGIKNMAGKAVDAAKGVATSAISGAKKLLGIKSPSKVFQEIGHNVTEGFVRGVDDSKGAIGGTLSDFMPQGHATTGASMSAIPTRPSGVTPINITINAQAFTGSQQDARKFAVMIMDAYRDAMAAKGVMV